MHKSKKYQEKLKLVDRLKLYSLDEAIALLKQTKRAKFDETVEVSVKLGHLKKGDTVRGTVLLPGGSGKAKKVAVIAKGDKLKEAEKAGADVFGSDELVEKIQGGFMDFDVLLATPDSMSSVGKLGRILGTKGLMPNPKSGTVTFDIEKTVGEFKAGKLEFKVDKTGVINVPAGKVSFDNGKIKENITTLINAVIKAKPPSAKGGGFVKSIALSTTMGPGIKVNINEFAAVAAAHGGE
ncbi:MAG: 50S ribosomal protein L1 [Candidatus Margulisbacteria bacterium]|nr:50S ribosomal protein L1 [Candidatus Margulisiibacteriota bacterium]MBU1021038.1 50S ribosomal protein L1 [Candidatus Margulisiibacteriota bacterium]MBU1729713.1 50S ribosomal protein L1 [Candidatus Margulisiibacteriota bacterium]MBU1955978.1 50S ribosomal protein L1 [Candidatus Margulisiibacteriota bacterium]